MDRKPLVVANWKANKTVKETLRWLEEFNWKLEIGNWKLEELEIIICPPYVALQPLKFKIQNSKFKIKLGAQDISPFPHGPYTGEVTAKMLQGLVDYVLVGHSERRRYFGEDNKLVGQKIKMAKKFGITPIICAATFEEIPTVVKKYKNFCIMYEPPPAISKEGVYRPDTPENAQRTIAVWKAKLSGLNCQFLYGGSVNPRNVVDFLSQKEIEGVVVGHASLDSHTFGMIVKNAQV